LNIKSETTILSEKAIAFWWYLGLKTRKAKITVSKGNSYWLTTMIKFSGMNKYTFFSSMDPDQYPFSHPLGTTGVF
jgi:hypothetical protein